MSDVLLWIARIVAILNIPLAVLILLGSSQGGTARGAVVAEWLALALLLTAVAAAVTAFRLDESASMWALLIVAAPVVPVLLLVRSFGPGGETPVRDSIIMVTAFAAPPLLLGLAGGVL